MLARLSSTLLLAALAWGLAASHSDAQGLHYRTIPIGERAIGLGGAYTGIADDPSATYYNPAGLMEGGKFSILGSLSSIVFTRKGVVQALAAVGLLFWQAFWIYAYFGTATPTPIERPSVDGSRPCSSQVRSTRSIMSWNASGWLDEVA